jgi:hypothetical protein
MRTATFVTFFAIISMQTACIDGGGGDDGESSNNGLLSSVINIGKANPPVEANTPPALQSSSSASAKAVHFAATYDECRAETLTALGITEGEWDDEAENYNNACTAGVDVKGRYFSGGPTEIRSVLSDIDGAVEGYKTRAENSYVPCVDPNNTAGGTLEETDYNAYSLVSKTSSFTFDDSETFDMGMTYKLSCIDRMVDENGGNTVRAFGIDNGTTYIYEGGDNGRGMIAKIDSDDNVEAWLGFASDPIEWSDSLVQYLGPGDAPNLTYPYSTGVAHLKSTAANNTIELTVTGVGLVEGCDAQLIMNDQYMFIQQNQNYYGTCYSGDDGTSGSGNIQYVDGNGDPDNTHSFDATIADAMYCMDVSGDDPTITTYENCVDAGLATCQDTDGVVDLLTSSTASALQGQPASCTGNFTLTRLNRQAIKVHNATHLFTALHSDVETFQTFSADLPPIDGTYEEHSLYMSKDRDTSTSSRVGAFCKDVPPKNMSPASDTMQDINEVFTLDLSTISSTALANLQSAKGVRVKFFVTHNDVADRGYADFSATATVDIDGTSRGVPVAFTYTAEATEQSGEIAIDEYASSLTSTSVIRITLSGTNQVKCHDSATNMTAASVAAGLGSPKVFFYTDPSENASGN